MLITEEKTDIVEKLLGHVCGTCAHARMDDRLPSDKRICRDGYGFKHMMDKGCGAWLSSESEE